MSEQEKSEWDKLQEHIEDAGGLQEPKQRPTIADVIKHTNAALGKMGKQPLVTKRICGHGVLPQRASGELTSPTARSIGLSATSRRLTPEIRLTLRRPAAFSQAPRPPTLILRRGDPPNETPRHAAQSLLDKGLTARGEGTLFAAERAGRGRPHGGRCWRRGAEGRFWGLPVFPVPPRFPLAPFWRDRKTRR